jgi:hypothetical protein
MNGVCSCDMLATLPTSKCHHPKNRVNKTAEFSKNCKIINVSHMCKGRAFLARKGPSYEDTFCL